MSSEELKPCAFCGGDVSFHRDEECPGCHLIQCGQCRAFFDFATGADPGNDCASVDALRAAIAPMWNARAQLAAIQGGMGEAVEVRGLQWLDTGHYRKKPPQFGYNPHDWNPLMTVAQHQRLMAAEIQKRFDGNEVSSREHREELAAKDARIAELRDEITQLNTALTIKNGTIAQLKARNAQLEDRNAALAVQVEARQVPEGWRVERRELDGSVCFIIGSPRIVGVRSNTSVWESDSDPAHLLLWHMLAAWQRTQSAGVPEGERLADLLESVRMGDDEAKPHGIGATYWNNAVIACKVAIRDALAAALAAQQSAKLLNAIDAELDASTGQEVKP